MSDTTSSPGMGGKSFQEYTSMLHAATASLPRFSTPIFCCSHFGGSNAG